ncbi:YqeG family HAD IIIA-type phosphatase [Bacillus marinisedimentorum]|uniref:YqeG family HAD IIIA-type phosphatase n=1 Tax=Bacillus marinisedimentorum TaxID=1821260 RepID=UPI000872D446|nr:YqeG family HAD IIIA-type phosphatase [Bacillus marinisedimentorum]
MLTKFLPNEHVRSVYEITPAKLKERGVKGVITDLDNTLVAWDEPYATPELIRWFKTLEENGIVVTIISNNDKQRVTAFSEPLGLPFIYRAQKPMSKAFNQALKDMKLSKDEVVVIGDQLLTDVLGANSIGLHSILVVPVAQSDGFFTKFNRKVESTILSWMRKKGMIYWEEKK